MDVSTFFSVPTPAFLRSNTLLTDETSEVPVFRTVPVVTLTPVFQGRPSATCLALDWAVKDNCSLVIAGFGDGKSANLLINMTIRRSMCDYY